MDKNNALSTPSKSMGINMQNETTNMSATEYGGNTSNKITSNSITNNNITDNNITTIPNFISTHNTTINANTTSSTTRQSTYATAVSDIQFPKPSQAVIIEAAPNTPLREYQIAIGKIVGNQNITFSSRMSKNRICIYLKTEELADTFSSRNPYIVINNQKLNVHKLKNTGKRITISEVPPYVSNIHLLDQLKRHNLEVLSPLILLKSNTKDPEFSHVYSFRRQATIKHTDNTKELPESLSIEFEGEYHRIYLSNDDLRCSECNNRGHMAEKCKKKTQDLRHQFFVSQEIITENQATPEIPTLPTLDRKKKLETSLPNAPTTSEDESEETSTTKEITISDKPLLSSQPCIVLENQGRQKKKGRPTKTSIENMLSPLKQIIKENETKYPLNYNNLKNFIIETKDIRKTREDMVQLATKYVEEKDQLCAMLDDLYPELEHQSIKSRFTTVTKLLKLDQPTQSTKIATKFPMQIDTIFRPDTPDNRSNISSISNSEADQDP